MLISVRGSGRFTEPQPVGEGGAQDVVYEVCDALDGVTPTGEWTAQSLLERSGVQVFKLVPMTVDEVLGQRDIDDLLKETAKEKNSR